MQREPAEVLSNTRALCSCGKCDILDKNRKFSKVEGNSLNHSESPDKLWNAGFLHLMFVNILNYSAFGIIVPLIPPFVVKLGANLAYAGIIAGVFSITALLTRPFTGLIGDRFNKKKLLIVSMVINGAAIVLYAVVPSIVWLVPVRILHGVMFSISGTVSFALGADFIPKDRLGEGVGYLGIGNIVGMAVGPNIGIYLAEHYSYPFCFVVSGIAIIVAGLSASALHCAPDKPKAAVEGAPPPEAFHLRNMIAVELLPNVFFIAIFAICIGVTNSYLVMHGTERGIGGIGLYFIVNSVVLLASRPILGKLADRKGTDFVVIPGYILLAASMLLIAQSHGLPPILWAAVIAAIGGGAMPAIQADCLQRLGSARRVVATGTYLIGMDIGISFGQIVGGIYSGAMGFGAAYSAAGVLTLAGLGCYLLYHRLEKRRVRQ